MCPELSWEHTGRSPLTPSAPFVDNHWVDRVPWTIQVCMFVLRWHGRDSGWQPRTTKCFSTLITVRTQKTLTRGSSLFHKISDVTFTWKNSTIIYSFVWKTVDWQGSSKSSRSICLRTGILDGTYELCSPPYTHQKHENLPSKSLFLVPHVGRGNVFSLTLEHIPELLVIETRIFVH
jgi:hypothetical protein